MRKVWIKKSGSFKEAEEFDDEYYRKMLPQDRLSDMQSCRQMYFKLKHINIDEVRKGLRRFYKVVK